VTPGLDEAACRIIDQSQNELCLIIQSSHGDTGVSKILETHCASGILVIYKSRCIFGNVREKRFSALDRVGPFIEMHVLHAENCSIIIGALGYCIARGAGLLDQREHPYSTLVRTRSSAGKISLEYEDHRLEPRVIDVP
jgi:hypothetical protein